MQIAIGFTKYYGHILNWQTTTTYACNFLMARQDRYRLSNCILRCIISENSDFTDQELYSRPPDPMNHAKIFKGWSPRDAPSELVPQWYKTFPPDYFGRVKMKKPTRFSNQNSTA